MEVLNNNEAMVEQSDASALKQINTSELHSLIETAKRYPRNVQSVINRVTTLATLDTETASECFYSLRRQGTIIEGESVRLAEIIASQWGNLLVRTRIVSNDGKMITAEAYAIDLETNFMASITVDRRITDRNGRTYSEDMQVMTGNAASAIAFRNVVMKVVPKSIFKRTIEEVKRVALGQALDMETKRQNMINWYAKLGVTKTQLCEYLGVDKIEAIDQQGVFELKSLANAIREGSTTVEESFKSDADNQKAKEAMKRSAEMKKRAEAAKKRQESITTETTTEADTKAETNEGKEASDE